MMIHDHNDAQRSNFVADRTVEIRERGDSTARREFHAKVCPGHKAERS